jgi:hypothetical protein
VSTVGSVDQAFGLVVRRGALTSSAAYRTKFGLTTMSTEWVSGAGAGTAIAGLSGISYVVNDIITLEAIGSTIRILRNGAPVASVTDTNVAGSTTSYAGLAIFSSSPGTWAFDDLVVKTG